MAESWTLVTGLAVGTFAIRLGGFLLGARLPAHGGWARAFAALPGATIAALVTVLLLQGGGVEWLAAAASLTVAMATRSLPIAMLTGVATVAVLRAAL